MKKIAAIIFCIIFTSMALSQQEYEEVVYLKNGSVIKGTIIERIPDVSIKIQTKDGNIFVYQMEEIDRITKESTKPLEQVDNVIAYGVHQHDGFFIRLTPGLGYSNFTEDIQGIDVFEFSGLSSASRLQIGGAVSQNLIIFGEFGAIIQFDPSMKLLGQSVDVTDVQLTISDFGGGITYYIMPANIYFALSLLVSQVTLEIQGNKAETESGFGFNVLIGKEWWVGDDWGLGIAGFGYYSTMDDKTVNGITPSISNTAFGILFTVTYN